MLSRLQTDQEYCHRIRGLPNEQCKNVSLAPELSLATIGSTIPVIEMPEGLPCPTLHEMACVLTQIGHMVMDRALPTHTIEGLGDETNTIPHIYAKGREALIYCAHEAHLWHCRDAGGK